MSSVSYSTINALNILIENLDENCGIGNSDEKLNWKKNYQDF